MRRVNVWVLVPAVLLALGVGLLVGRASDDDKETASARSTTTSSSTSTTEAETTTTEDTTSTTSSASTTTTTAAAGARTTTTVRASTPATQTATATTISGGTPSNSACGPGTAGAGARLVVTAKGEQPQAVWTYSGPVTVTNNTGKAIELTALVIRITSKDGTVEDVAVNGAVGTVVADKASTDFPFSYSTSKEPKDTEGTSVAKFSYKPPGGTTNCAST